MRSTALNKLILFVANTQLIKKDFIWQDTLTKRLAALLYAQEGRAVDCEAIKQCHSLIKQNNNVFSAFRGNMALCLATLFSLSPDSQKLFEETKKVYELLKEAKFHASDYLVIAAFQIAAHADSSDYENVVSRMRTFYDRMKALHFFHTGQDDYVFTAMLGLSDLDTDIGTEYIEQLYQQLKGEFWAKNSIQALAQVLVLGSSDEQTVNRIVALRDAFREQKIMMDKTYTLPFLGILALMPAEIDSIVRDIAESQSILREQKGFGSLSVTKQELLLFAASFIASEYTQNVKDGLLTATLSTNIINLMIAQQVAMIAAISASHAAVAASSSSS